MHFAIDAHLPRKLAARLNSLGHDAIHTLDLPGGNATEDIDIITLADAQGRVVVSKDADFVFSRRQNGRPALLLQVATGNIANKELLDLFTTHIAEIVTLFAAHGHLLIGRDGVTLGL